MKKRIKLLLWVALASLVVNAILFWLFELEKNSHIENFFDVCWWWVVTSTTLGYGDIVPITWQGRIVSIFTIITGFFIYTNFVAIIAASAHGFLERKNHGKMQVHAQRHIVICEYTAIADELIQAIDNTPSITDREIVIVSDLVTRNPYPQHLFVCGVPINPSFLRQANIEKADYVFIFANQRFADPDVKTLHVASRVLKLNSNARVFVELVDPENELAKDITARLTIMNSRDLIKAVLQDKRLDPLQWIKTGKQES
ncbi:ion channel [Verrucomicrobiota bacterium]